MAKLVTYGGSRYGGYRVPVADRVNLVALMRKGFRMFRSRWWIVLVTLILSTGVGVYRSYNTPDTYRAVSRLGIAPRVAFSQRSMDRAVVLEEKNNFAENQLEYMRGNQVLGRVEEKMQEFRLPDGGVPGKRLSVSQGSGSTFIMSVESPNLEYARQFARTWAQEFLAFKEQRRSEIARKQIDKTRVDISGQEEAVAEAQKSLEDFMRRHGIATSEDTGNAAQQLLIGLQRSQQNARITRQRLELKSAEELADDAAEAAQQSAALAAAAVVASGVAVSAPGSGTTTGGEGASGAGSAGPMDTVDPLEKFVGKSNYRELKLSLERIQAEIRRQSENLKPRHPFMVELEESRVETERQIRAQLAMVEEMRKARIASLKQEEEVLERQITDQKAEVERYREINRQYLALSQDLVGKRELLNRLNRDLQALSQIPVSEEDITILEEGAASDRPIGPMRSRLVITGVAVGLIVGLGLIFLLHRLDDRADSAEEIEKVLDEPILGQIPLVSRRDLRGASVALVDSLEPNNIFVEAFRGVRSSVMFGDLGGPKQVLMATSSIPGDGKSTFTVNFAITLAKAGNRVLLIDADLRRGVVSEAFDLPSEPGLSEVLGGLEDWRDVLNATPHRTLLLITSGKSVTNPGELLLSKTMKTLVAEARQEFDYVIFDSPPVLGMDDAPTLATHCDGLLFVYRVGVTSLKLARVAVNTLRQRGGQILGLILNGVSIATSDYYYTAYYYSHYTYGGARRKRELEDGEPAPPRPAGARLLRALKEAEASAGAASPAETLLAGESGEAGAVDVRAASEEEGARPSDGSGKPGADGADRIG